MKFDVKELKWTREPKEYTIKEDSSFKATFTHMEMTECKWLAHDGQQPDEE